MQGFLQPANAKRMEKSYAASVIKNSLPTSSTSRLCSQATAKGKGFLFFFLPFLVFIAKFRFGLYAIKLPTLKLECCISHKPAHHQKMQHTNFATAPCAFSKQPAHLNKFFNKKEIQILNRHNNFTFPKTQSTCKN